MHRRTLLAALGTLGVGSAAATLSAATLSETSSLNARFKVCVSGVNASGGRTTYTFTDDENQAYKIHVFDTVGTHTFTVNDAGNCGADDVVDVLVVAGGGGGGSSLSGLNKGCGGGGGAGGLVFEEDFAISTGDYTVEVGAGGDKQTSLAKKGNNGDDSTAFGLTAIGGGGGGAGNDSGSDGRDGGSGGGAGNDGGSGGDATQPGTNPNASEDAGEDGGDNSTTFGDMTAGGGGADGVGESIPKFLPEATNKQPGGDGGDGMDFSDKFGTNFGEDDGGQTAFFAGGGGGGANNAAGANGNPGDGGPGGGGDGGGVGEDGDDATATTGGGGGGAGSEGQNGGAGGSGIVLIRYAVE
jgi:hypothetical protein